MPGYDDRKIRPGAGFARDREGGAYYERSWQAALASTPNWVVITSFNEWPEGSFIEPSAAYGGQYLGLTATWSAQFKSGVPAPDVDSSTAATVENVENVAAAAPVPDAPTAVVSTELLNLRAGPGTDFELLGRVGAGTVLPITGRPADGAAWWQVSTDYGPAWVLGELVQATGPLAGVPAVATQSVTRLQPDTGFANSGGSAAEPDAAPTFILTIGDRTVELRPARGTEP